MCTKKRKKNLFQNDLNECIFVYVHGKRGDAGRGRLLLVKTGGGKLACLVAFLCLFPFFFIRLSFFLFIFTFLLSLLHHNRHFLLTFIDTRSEEEEDKEKSSRRCNDEAKPFICTALCSMALASVRPADMVLLFAPSFPSPPVNLLSFNCTYCSYTSSQKHLNLLFSFFL